VPITKLPTTGDEDKEFDSEELLDDGESSIDLMEMDCISDVISGFST
jgi:hypothetical protein